MPFSEKKIYNICKPVVHIRLRIRFRPNIPLNIRQNFGFGRSGNFYIRSTSKQIRFLASVHLSLSVCPYAWSFVR